MAGANVVGVVDVAEVADVIGMMDIEEVVEVTGTALPIIDNLISKKR